MMIQRLGWSLGIWLLSIVILSAQSDAMLDIDTIVVISTKPAPTNNSAFRIWNRKALENTSSSTISELVAREGVYIKNYGPGSIATSSIRGGSAGHTLMLWNGLPLQSPMLGLFDLSMLPINGPEEVILQKGGHSAMWGSGAIGGIISLNNRPDFSQRVLFQSQSRSGSFGLFEQQFKIGLGNEHFQSVTKINHLQADNNFPYRPAPELPERKQTNAFFSQQNILQDIYWRINDQQQLSAHFWRQSVEREIPPTLTQTRSKAQQSDASTRLLVNWQMRRTKSIWQARVGFFDEDLIYTDERIGLESPSNFKTLLAEFSTQWQWKKHHWYLGTTQNYTEASTTNYNEGVSEFRPSIFTNYKFQQANWQIQASLRQEWSDGRRVPLIPTMELSYQPIEMLTLNFKMSRNYRLPTLNDRFWLPGGNLGLRPEDGWSQEIAISNQQQWGKLKMIASLTAFNRQIDDWILWSIQPDQSFWSANNITKVWSRGLEPRLNISQSFRQWQWQWRFGYDYIRSTNQVALEAPRMTKGQQLIYTPRHQAHTHLSIKWHQWTLSYQHIYFGATRGINDPLEAYQLAHARLQYQLQEGAYAGTIFLNVNNLWNTDYLVVERRAMPGINYNLGVRFRFRR